MRETQLYLWLRDFGLPIWKVKSCFAFRNGWIMLLKDSFRNLFLSSFRLVASIMLVSCTGKVSFCGGQMATRSSKFVSYQLSMPEGFSSLTPLSQQFQSKFQDCMALEWLEFMNVSLYHSSNEIHWLVPCPLLVVGCEVNSIHTVWPESWKRGGSPEESQGADSGIMRNACWVSKTHRCLLCSSAFRMHLNLSFTGFLLSVYGFGLKGRVSEK